MPAKKKKIVDGGLGRSILKRAERDRRERRQVSSTGFHVADIAQSNNPLQSITMLSSLEDFVAGAAMADRTFAAERVNISFVPEYTPAPSAAAARRGQAAARDLVDTTSGTVRALQIPRRPRWDADVPIDELHRAEKDAFLDWRRRVAAAEADLSGGAAVTPFEKNLEVWRQLWRVVERSDVLVQIVDARNPLFFHSADLDAYVREVSDDKRCLLLVNKADYLTAAQRLAWARFLSSRGMQFVFFSAKRELDRLEELDRAQAAYTVGCGPAAASLQELARPWGLGDEAAATGLLHPPVLVAATAAPLRLAPSSVAGDAKLAEALRRAFLATEDSSDEEDEGVPEGSGAEAPAASGVAAAETPSSAAAAAAASGSGGGGPSGGLPQRPVEPSTAAPPASQPPQPPVASEGEGRDTESLTGVDPDDPLAASIRVLSREELLDYLQVRVGGGLGEAARAASCPHNSPPHRARARVCPEGRWGPARRPPSGGWPSCARGSVQRQWRRGSRSCGGGERQRSASSRWGSARSCALRGRETRSASRAARKGRGALTAQRTTRSSARMTTRRRPLR